MASFAPPFCNLLYSKGYDIPVCWVLFTFCPLSLDNCSKVCHLSISSARTLPLLPLSTEDSAFQIPCILPRSLSQPTTHIPSLHRTIHTSIQPHLFHPPYTLLQYTSTCSSSTDTHPT